MTLVIGLKGDLGSVTRKIVALAAEHPGMRYETHGGEYGEIIVDIDPSTL